MVVIIRVPLSPPSIVFCFQSFPARWISTGFLSRAYPWMGDKGVLAIWTWLPFHLGSLRDWNDSNHTSQRKKKTKKNEKEKDRILSGLEQQEL